MEVERHFKLTEETIAHCGHTLHRIMATCDSLHAKKGDKGGWIETEGNLQDEAWVRR